MSNTVDLTSALANTAASHIVLAPGTYYLSAQLSITRSVAIEAAAAGSVVLHAQASSSSPRRVLNINPGSSGVVQLIGLNITGGYIVSWPPDGYNTGGGVAVVQGLVSIVNCQLYSNQATNGGGVAVMGGTVSIVSSQIYSNAATWDGGGVYVSSGTVTITSSSIHSNSAAWGSNVYARDGGTVCSWATTLTGVYEYGGTVSACAAPPPSPPPPSPPNIVSTVAGLTSALANTAVSHIVLAPGTYYLSAELNITRSVVLEAAVAGSVVLNGQASYSNQRRVLSINPALRN